MVHIECYTVLAPKGRNTPMNDDLADLVKLLSTMTPEELSEFVAEAQSVIAARLTADRAG